MVVKTGRIAHVNAAPKRLYAGIIALALLCALSLVGCGSSTPGASSTASSGAVELVESTVTITDADGQATSYVAQVPSTDATALAVLQATDAEITTEDGQFGTYITSIDGLAAEGSSGWVYTVNGEQVMESADTCPVANGDTVEFSYITM